MPRPRATRRPRNLSFHAYHSPGWPVDPVDLVRYLFYAFKAVQISVFAAWCRAFGGDAFSRLAQSIGRAPHYRPSENQNTHACHRQREPQSSTRHYFIIYSRYRLQKMAT